MLTSSSPVGYEQLGSQGMQASGSGGTFLLARTGGNLIYSSTLTPTSLISPNSVLFKMGQVMIIMAVCLLSLMRFSRKSGDCVLLAGLLACIIHYFIVLGRICFLKCGLFLVKAFPV